MTKEEFVAQLERGAVSASGLPVTSAVLRWTAEQLKRGDPPWWKAVAKAWDKRVFVAWSEAWGLYLAALHFEALNDADSPLVPFFPSCGGTAEADPLPGWRDCSPTPRRRSSKTCACGIAARSSRRGPFYG